MTDLHFGEKEKSDLKVNDFQYMLFENDKPDFVVFTGDAISDYSWNGKDKNYFQNSWKLFTKPVTDKKIPYAYILGNHDGGVFLFYI